MSAGMHYEAAVEMIRILYPVEKLETLEPGVLRVGFSGDPPTDWLENGRLVGLHGGVRQQVAEILSIEVRPLRMGWPLMIPSVESGEIDVPGLGVAWTEERERNFAYTQPYQYYFGGVVRRRADDNTNLIELDELANLSIAAIANSWNLREVETMIRTGKIFTHETMDILLADVIDGRADAGIYDLPNLRVALERHPRGREFEILPFKFDRRYPRTTGRFPVHLLFRREAANLRAAADLAVDLLKGTGKLKEMYERFGFGEDLLFIG